MAILTVLLHLTSILINITEGKIFDHTYVLIWRNYYAELNETLYVCTYMFQDYSVKFSGRSMNFVSQDRLAKFQIEGAAQHEKANNLNRFQILDQI